MIQVQKISESLNGALIYTPPHEAQGTTSQKLGRKDSRNQKLGEDSCATVSSTHDSHLHSGTLGNHGCQSSQ